MWRFFAPRAPETLEAFNVAMDRLAFDIYINGDAYQIAFETNGLGELAVSRFEQG